MISELCYTSKELGMLDKLRGHHMSGTGPNTGIPNDSPLFICQSCATVKLREEFYFDKKGRPTKCKICVKEYAARRLEANPNGERERAARYREANQDRVRESAARHRVNNPDRARERNKSWREANPDKVREGSFRSREANRGKNRESAARYRADNPDRVRESAARWRADNPDRVRECAARWKKANPDKMREYEAKRRSCMADHSGIHPLMDSIIIRTMPCYFLDCKNTDITMDHIIPFSKGGIHEDQNVAPLCRSHNSSKNDRTFEEWAKSAGISAQELEQAAYDANGRALDLLEFMTKARGESL